MKNATKKTKRACGKPPLCCVVLLLGLLAVQGCSTATAAGCGVGVLTTLAIVGLSAAVSPVKVDAGPLILGGTLLGAAAGCSGAAVAEDIASADRRSPRHASAQSDESANATPQERRQLMAWERQMSERPRVQRSSAAPATYPPSRFHVASPSVPPQQPESAASASETLPAPGAKQ